MTTQTAAPAAGPAPQLINERLFDRVMRAIADRVGRKLEAGTLEMYRLAISKAGVTDEEFAAAAETLFTTAEYWNELPPKAFIDAALAARRRGRQAELRSLAAARALPAAPESDGAVPLSQLVPQFEPFGQRSTRCACGRWFLQELLSAAYLDRAKERWRRALLALYPERLVPHECPRCTRLANQRDADRAASTSTTTTTTSGD